jgi:SSS family solute:Na+ symporter
MIVGFIVGIFRMLVDTLVTMGAIKSYPEGSFLWIVNNINFQYFSILITLISALVMIVVSYMTAAPDYAKIKSLTFSTTTAEDRANTHASWGAGEIVASIFIVACILGAYLYFTG